MSEDTNDTQDPRINLVNQLKAEAYMKAQKEVQERQNSIIANQQATKQILQGIKDQELEGMWKEFEQNLKSFQADLVRGYDNIPSAAMSMIAFQMKACEIIKKIDPLGKLLELIIEVMGINRALVSLLDRLHHGEPAVTLPTLQHYVEFSDENKLVIESLTNNVRRSDNVEFTPEQKEFINDIYSTALITAWLGNRGYKPENNHPNPKFVKENDGTLLTKAKFEELRDDPERGLDSFLSQHLPGIQVSTVRPGL